MNTIEKQTISIEETFAGKHILLTGASGFLGKIWLAMILDRVPDVGRIYVLLRKKGLRSPFKRFERMLGSNHAFTHLHDTHGEGLGIYLAERVEVISGDIRKDGIGIDEEVAKRLHRDLDLVINCAGLVDFDPDLRDAISTNVGGAVSAAEFTAACDHAALLHVSTCYVAGCQQGQIKEIPVTTVAPNGEAFNAREEWAAAQAAADAIVKAFDTPENDASIHEKVQERIARKDLDPENETLVSNMLKQERNRRLKKLCTEEGRRRAAQWGWPNIYTYSKGLSEAIVMEICEDIPLTFFRPAIVESAVSYPFPGWVEGFNTSAPLMYLLGTWFRQLPAKKDQPFDVVPVDLVCNGITLAAAALMKGIHAPVYHCGTSAENRLTIERACELTALGHRVHLREHGETALERVILSRWDGVIEEQGHLFSTTNLLKLAKGAGEILRNLPKGLPPVVYDKANEIASLTDMAENQLKGIERAIDAFKPFTTDYQQIFETQALQSLQPVEEAFRFAPEEISWRSYWIDVHMPGARKWTFPEFEGKPVPKYKPPTPFSMPESILERNTENLKRKAKATR